jgi:hypothetical protein
LGVLAGRTAALELVQAKSKERNVSLLTLVSDRRFAQNFTGQRKTA